MLIGRGFLMWWMFKQFFGGGTGKPAPREEQFWPRMAKGEPVDMWVYMSEKPYHRPHVDSEKFLIWQESGLPLAIVEERHKQIIYHPSKAVQNNGTLFVHVFFAKEGASLDPSSPAYDADAIFSKSESAVAFLPKPKVKEGVNLLSGKDSLGVEVTNMTKPVNSTAPREIVSFLKPNITISLVDDFQAYKRGGIPPQIVDFMDLDEASMTYSPTVFFNEFWLLRDHLVPLNETVSEVKLHFFVNSIGLWKWTIMTQMEQSFNMQKNFGAMADGESDEFKRVLIEGNPYLLALTFAVSLLHSVFDMLAFKNDIGFWKNKKSVEGLSVRTILINCFCQLVIFLYLLDNETSMVVLGSAGIGTLIEFWKVTKAMDVSIDRTGAFPRLRFKDKAGYDASNTRQHDKQAMVYLSYALYPLVIGYAVYALVYETHRSWYSWILNSLVGAVYTFGFILMCPQLYLNYKLQSVAHLPWRQMTYKFLNTIIDDLFAFVIKMPTLHRLSVFRDDLVFAVYLYQRWAYRVDKKRPNEFGYVAEEPDAEPTQLEGRAADATVGPSTAATTKAIVSAEEPSLADEFEDISAEVKQLRQRKAGDSSILANAERVSLASAPTDVKKQK
ncbi:hypothetical protein WJX72_000698 [[Myrmecia] bisecta]|uniref:Cleft lip and palate associated transmembrane protein n=1 Tax=[Myrmecia] bisecta TaxID=41462 RepID=A0AAW1PW61_9CHLO